MSKETVHENCKTWKLNYFLFFTEFLFLIKYYDLFWWFWFSLKFYFYKYTYTGGISELTRVDDCFYRIRCKLSWILNHMDLGLHFFWRYIGLILSFLFTRSSSHLRQPQGERLSRPSGKAKTKERKRGGGWCFFT